jgi:hypothetical protein
MYGKIKVPVNGGYIVAERNPDPDYDGISICFESDKGTIADIVLVEAKAINDYKEIDIYTYDNEYDEDWTRATSVNTDEYKKAFNESEED